jgi:hypothetical protein
LDTLVINTQEDVDLLAGYDGVDGNLYIFNSDALTDTAPLENLREVTGDCLISTEVDPAAMPMLGLRFVGGSLIFNINWSVLTLDGWGYNITRVNGDVQLRGAVELASFGTNFMRRLYHVGGTLQFRLGVSDPVSLDGVFGCLTEVGRIEFLEPQGG